MIFFFFTQSVALFYVQDLEVEKPKRGGKGGMDSETSRISVQTNPITFGGLCDSGKLINFSRIMTSIALVGMRNRYGNVCNIMCNTWQVHKKC